MPTGLGQNPTFDRPTQKQPLNRPEAPMNRFLVYAHRISIDFRSINDSLPRLLECMTASQSLTAQIRRRAHTALPLPLDDLSGILSVDLPIGLASTNESLPALP